jgi:type I restriction enzyme S subunit
VVKISKNQDCIVSSEDTTNYLLKKGDIVVSMDFDCGRVGKIINDNWVLNQRMSLLRANLQYLTQDYLYWELLVGKFHEDMTNINTGTTIKHISGKNIASAMITLPPLPIQQEIVSNLDRIFADPQDMKDCLAFTDKAMDLMLKDPTGKRLEDVLGGLRLKRAYLTDAASVKSQMAAVVRSVGARGFEREHIRDVMNVVSGKANQDRKEGRPVPYYDSNGIIGYVAEPLYTGEYTITARNLSIGAVHYINGSFYPSDHTINFTSLDQNIMNNRFFYNWLHLNNQVLKELSSGIKPGIRKSDVAEILMPVPPIEFQHEVLAILNEMEAELATLEQMAAKAEQRAKFILDGYLTPVAPTETSVAESDEEESETNTIITPPPIEKEKDYKSMSKADLLALCKERKIKGVSTKKKEELIEILSK